MENMKLVVVGDGGVGKSCLLIASTTGSFPGEYVPTVFDNYSANMMIDGKPYNLGLWDTAGQVSDEEEDYDRLRPLSYPQTDVLFVCFDISNRDSFQNIEAKWIPELDHYCSDVPRILVGCKSDLRGDRSLRAERCVSFEEGKKMAASVKCCRYLETSALHVEGLTGMFELAVRVGVAGMKASVKRKKGGFFAVKKKTGSGPPQIILPPVMPPTGFAPEIEIETCTIGEQWLASLHQGSCADTALILPSGVEIKSHKTVLSSASEVFKKAFGIEHRMIAEKSQMEALMKRTEFDHPAISKVQIDDLHLTKIYLTDKVEPEVLKHALEFFYSGTVSFDDDPSTELLDSIREFCDMFDLPYLKQICDNVENDEEFLNPSIGTYVCDLNGQKMKALFFNQQTYADADVKFTFGDKTVYGHKSILSARNKIMAAMFDGRFLETRDDQMTTIDMTKDNELTIETFLLMLEYLYTGHAPLDNDNVDLVSLLVLSDQYNITRLSNLCELYLTKLVDRKCVKNIEKADIDVIGLLNVSNIYNAPQLAKWCRFFISSNYLPFSTRTEWNQLSSEDLEHVEEQRWPPVDYLNELTEYEKLVEAQRTEKHDRPGCIMM